MRTIRSYIIIIIIIPLSNSLLANEKNILSNSLNQFLGTKKKSIADHIYILKLVILNAILSRRDPKAKSRIRTGEATKYGEEIIC